MSPFSSSFGSSFAIDAPVVNTVAPNRHVDLLKVSLAPVSYDTTQRAIEAELIAEGQALDDAYDAASNVLNAIFPNNGETLEDWERVYGLPCDCVSTLALTRDQRLKNVIAKINEGGTFTKAKAKAHAANVGFNIDIVEHRAAEYGRAKNYGQASRYGGRDWNFVWDVITINNTIFQRKYQSNFGEQYQSWGNELLECTIKPKVQSGTLVRFIYI